MNVAEALRSVREVPLKLQLEVAIHMGYVGDVEHFADELDYDNSALWKAMGQAYRYLSHAYEQGDNASMAAWALEQGLRYDIASANNILRGSLAEYSEAERQKSPLWPKK